MMRIALFGCGQYLIDKAEQIFGKVNEDILYICDNDSQKWGAGARMCITR